MEKYGIDCENFDGLFNLEASKLTSEEKGRVPKSLLAKAYRKQGKMLSNKLDFFEKLYFLFVAKNKQMFLVFEDEENGLGVEDFVKRKKEIKYRKHTEDEAENLISKGTIVLGNTEVIKWLRHLNHLSVSAAYNYVLKIKNTPKFHYSNLDKEFNYLGASLKFYEGNKRKIARQFDISIPEFYFLIHLCDGKERTAPSAYDEAYKEAYNANRHQFLLAIKSLITRNYVEKFNRTRCATYKITASGLDLYRNIITKYFIPNNG